MIDIKQKPLIIDLFASTEEEFDRKVKELENQGWEACESLVKAVNIYKQTFIKKDVESFKYITDYLFETEVSGRFDNGIVNKLYDRWNKEESFLSTSFKKPWFKEI